MKLIFSEFLLAVTIPAGITIVLHFIFNLSAKDCFSIGMLLGFASGGVWMKSGRLNAVTSKLSELYRGWF